MSLWMWLLLPHTCLSLLWSCCSLNMKYSLQTQNVLYRLVCSNTRYPAVGTVWKVVESLRGRFLKVRHWFSSQTCCLLVTRFMWSASSCSRMPPLHDGLKLLLVKYLVTAMRQLSIKSSALSWWSHPTLMCLEWNHYVLYRENQNGDHWWGMDTTSRFSSWVVKTCKESTEKPERLWDEGREQVQILPTDPCVFIYPKGKHLGEKMGLKFSKTAKWKYD